ncbi:uricase isoform X1 [Phyllopteryx taeniolatus]|uniref:uricase isoform X1 n=1 Tax=Phyllopteryx taeniolatus TaxID=161469 RepID=UPI002AD1FB3A|nr:uricase isoform X1 [Phyllopteryx taeniolatus]
MATAFAQNVEFVRTGYGKNTVKVLCIRRQGGHHDIIEIKADVQLTLKSRKDYLTGDNSDIIPTDTIKNTVHALAKLKGVKTIEQFSLDICRHFLTSFNHVLRAKVHMEEVPWRRLEKIVGSSTPATLVRISGSDNGWMDGTPHTHSLTVQHSGIPVVHGGLKDMKVLKTTQSGFWGFLRDRFTTLQEAMDRCFCTTVYARWRYNKVQDVNFDAAWKSVKDTITEKFAGPFDHGEFSPSVQKTLYDAQVLVLSRAPEVDEIEIIMPNNHYFTIDMTKMGIENKGEVLLPLDNPSGIITGTVRRKQARL